MSGGSSRPLANGDSASASKRPSGTHSIAAWCALASSSLEYQTPTMCFPDRHASSLALPSPTTARHCAPTRFSAVMPTVQPSREAWPTTWSSVWIDCGRRMRGIASISARLSKSFMPKTWERSFNSRSRSPESLVQSVIASSPRFGVHARHCLGKPTVRRTRNSADLGVGRDYAVERLQVGLLAAVGWLYRCMVVGFRAALRAPMTMVVLQLRIVGCVAVVAVFRLIVLCLLFIIVIVDMADSFFISIP